MAEEKSFHEEMQPIIDSLQRRETIAKKLAGKNLFGECLVFHLPLPREVWKFDDSSTHNTKRGPNYLYIFVKQEEDRAILIDDIGGGGVYKRHRKHQELTSLPVNELVNYQDYLTATFNDSE